MPVISEEYWVNFAGIVVAFSVLALVIERGLYQVFDSKLWAKIEASIDQQAGGDFFDLKPWLSIVISEIIVFNFKLDMISMLFNFDQPAHISMFVTGLFVAGGSTSIYKFFKQARELKQAINKQAITQAGGQSGQAVNG